MQNLALMKAFALKRLPFIYVSLICNPTRFEAGQLVLKPAGQLRNELARFITGAR